MSWITLSILSALFLGIYDLLKKHAVRDNAVLPVLFFGVVAGASVWLPFVIWSAISAESIPLDLFRVENLTTREHVLLLAKSALVSGSWLMGYFALKHLPLSTAGPIRSTGPLWTVFIAVALVGEAPNSLQWVGIAVILISFYAFSLTGRKEGIDFLRNHWVLLMTGATILGACSSVYDKYLLQKLGIPPNTVQAWFSLYLVPVLFPFYFWWLKKHGSGKSFTWRWSIPLIGIGLLLADIVYFTAIRDPKALISVISPVRRMSVLITFFGGVILYHERTRVPAKCLCLAGMLVGIYILNRALL